MSAHVADLKAQRDRALAKADEILAGAERGRRSLTVNESATIKQCTAQASDLNAEITRVENAKNPRAQLTALRAQITPGQQLQMPQAETLTPAKFTAAYLRAFTDYVSSRGKNMSASLTEGVNTAGGFAVPSEVGGEIVPLAPSDLAVRRLATVIPTTKDIRVPAKSSQSAATAKAETAGFNVVAGANLSQFTLSAFLAGAQEETSFEIAQDISTLKAFCIDDLSIGVQEYEENLFINGTGVGQPQGLIGNVGAGITGAVADGQGNLLSIDATFNVLPTLKDAYHNNASWLMQRTTALEIRLAQKQSNLFEPVFRRENGVDLLHGYPVFYSGSMPAIAAGATPALFGDFRRGYIIGDRGGSALQVKVLDQTLALQGLIVLLGYRRTDGRVRRSEAIQGITLHT